MDLMNTEQKFRPDTDWDASVEFLQATDTKKVEKTKKSSKIGAVIGVLVFAAVVALMTGLLVWHFNFRKDEKIKKMYSGSMTITDQVFDNAYENSSSPEFTALALQVTQQLKQLYSKSPLLKKHYVGSTVQAFSEGSVIAYYLSEFLVPSSQESAVDKIMADPKALVDGGGRSSITLMQLADITTSALDDRFLSASFQRFMSYSEHVKPGYIGHIQSPGFPDSPYPPNSFMQWQLRADPGHIIQLKFDTVNLEDNCTNDFVKVYDSLVAIEGRALEEMCGRFSPNEPLTFLSSRNVMLVMMATNDKKNYPGFRAEVSQILRKDVACGAQLSGVKGRFSSPNFPNFYPPQTTCLWSIEVPEGKVVKVTFKKFYMLELGQKYDQGCRKDFVEINNKKLCGEHPAGSLTETSQTNKMTVTFYSDASLVDRGFEAEFEAVDNLDLCPGKFTCANQLCISSTLKCDGYNDCRDMSDERNCVCNSNSIQCGNGFCKAKFWQCDGIDDCGDGTDEKNCGGCKSGEIRCSNDKCVSEKMRCDGYDNCGDGSDELGCSKGSVTCTESTYRCKNNKCISTVNPECDGNRDCDDGSDEANCDCGKKYVNEPRIVGGQAAYDGEFPWQVSLHVKPFGHVCGASIISPTWLVTAAHCVQDDSNARFSQPGTWDAYLGLNVQKKTDGHVEMRKLKQIIQHPYYNAYTYDNDIALMELDSPVSYSAFIRPICLPSPQHFFNVGDTVSISGWGATREGGSAATILQKAQVRIINQTLCDTLMGGALTSKMLCAGVLEGGVDACQGDSGGPLGSSSGSRMFLAGVVSWGDGCARRNKPGIYTRVTKFRGWITEKTGV